MWRRPGAKAITSEPSIRQLRIQPDPSRRLDRTPTAWTPVELSASARNPPSAALAGPGATTALPRGVQGSQAPTPSAQLLWCTLALSIVSRETARKRIAGGTVTPRAALPEPAVESTSGALWARRVTPPVDFSGSRSTRRRAPPVDQRHPQPAAHGAPCGPASAPGSSASITGASSAWRDADRPGRGSTLHLAHPEVSRET